MCIIYSPLSCKGDVYFDELARQLSDFFDVLLPKHTGMMSIVDAYYYFNYSRASGQIHYLCGMMFRPGVSSKSIKSMSNYESTQSAVFI